MMRNSRSEVQSSDALIYVMCKKRESGNAGTRMQNEGPQTVALKWLRWCATNRLCHQQAVP